MTSQTVIIVIVCIIGGLLVGELIRQMLAYFGKGTIPQRVQKQEEEKRKAKVKAAKMKDSRNTKKRKKR